SHSYKEFINPVPTLQIQRQRCSTEEQEQSRNRYSIASLLNVNPQHYQARRSKERDQLLRVSHVSQDKGIERYARNTTYGLRKDIENEVDFGSLDGSIPGDKCGTSMCGRGGGFWSRDSFIGVPQVTIVRINNLAGVDYGYNYERGGEGESKKPQRHKSGTQALREIRRLQKTVNLIVKEICNYFAPEVTRWQAEALQALQEAAEDFIVQMFEDSMLCAIHAKRVTLS
ncbi:histone H3-like centromeric protein HTR12, partial [Tanacetum coccineum]